MLTFIAIGLAAGVLAGLFGIGGGVLIVPALMYFGGLPIKTATGTSLMALLLPVGLLGAVAYWRAGHIEIRSGLLVAAGLFLGAWFGARLALSAPPAVMQKLFAVLLVIVAVRMFLKA